MKPGIPWSVKGIDGKAREVAKDAARAEGLTLGEWLNQKILEAAQEDAELKARATRRKATSSTVSRKPAAPARAPAPAPEAATAAAVAPVAPVRDPSATIIASKLDELFDRIAGLKQPEPAPLAPAPSASADSGASALAMEKLLDRIESSEKHTHASIVHLGDKVERIGVKVEELAERPADIKARDLPGFAALEGAVRNIVDHIEKSEAKSRDTMTSLQKRMAELSGKVETPSAAPSISPQAVKDLESRMSQLAAQVEKVSAGTGDQQLKQIFEARIRELAERIDTMRHSAEAMSQKAEATASKAAEEQARAIESRLAVLVAQAETKLAEAGNGARGLEEVQLEIAQLHNRFEEIRQQAASEHEVQALRSALENLSSRVDENPAQEPIALIEQRIAELTEQLNQVAQPVDLQPHIGQLEQRLHAIDMQMAAPQVQTDPALVHQITQIEHRLAATEQQLGSLGTIESSIQQLFQSLERSQAETRELITGAASNAAVATEAMEPATSSPEFKALQDGLAAVRANAEAADQRTQETLEAVHETLAQIIDKLGELDRPGATGASAAAVDDIAAKAAAAASALAGNYEAHQPVAADASSFAAAAAAAAPAIDLGQIPPSPASAQFSPFDDPFSINAGPAPMAQPAQPQQARPAQAEDWLSVVRAHMSEQHGATREPFSMPAGGQTDFIAAARRAASAAAPSSPAGAVLSAGAGFGDIPAPTADETRRSRLASLLSRDGSKATGGAADGKSAQGSSRKRLMLAALVLLAAVSAYTVNSGSFSSGPVQQSSIQLAPVTSSVEQVSSLQSSPQVSVAKSDLPTGTQPVELPQAPAADPMTTASLGTGASDPMLSQQPALMGEPAAAMQPAPVETVAAAETLPAEIGTEALRNAANSGDAKAQFIIASRFLEGRTVERNHDAAARWYTKAANGGLSAAQYRIGTLYERGSGVTQDRASAMDWYAKAAEQGNVKAMHNLAVMSADSTKGQPDMATAARWFAAAAGYGLPDSQYNLAVLNERGLGVQKNFNEAYKWFKLAARQGDRDAVTKAEAIRRQIDASTAGQIDQLVASWKPMTPDRDANMVSISEPAWGIQQPQQQAAAAPAAPAPAMNAQPITPLSAKDQVRRAQELLAQKGFDAGPADGSMGTRTANAIRLYQLRNGLPVNGSVSKQLLSHLQQGTI